VDSIWREIEQLRDAPLAQIRLKYREVFQEEPRSQHREHLLRRLAWRLQAAAQGGLSEAAHERAQEIANEADMRVLPPPGFMDPHNAINGRSRAHLDRRIPRPGAVLKRNYGGATVVVKVLRDGFEFEGRRYGSLSAIATAVTGTRWNGLAFFGLTHRTKTKGARHV